jgi:hypothetical protein
MDLVGDEQLTKPPPQFTSSPKASVTTVERELAGAIGAGRVEIFGDVEDMRAPLRGLVLGFVLVVLSGGSARTQRESHQRDAE